MQFLSENWAKAYLNLWNSSENLMVGLKNFNNVIEYKYDDKDLPPVQIDIKNGKCIYAGSVIDGRKADFEIWATTENWKNIVSGAIGVRSAMLTKKLGFKGSMTITMQYMSPFFNSIEMMSRIEAKI